MSASMCHFNQISCGGQLYRILEQDHDNNISKEALLAN